MVKLIIPDKKKEGKNWIKRTNFNNENFYNDIYIYNHYDQLTRYFSNLTFKALK